MGTGAFLADTSGHQNRKLQLSLEPKHINRALTAETVTTGMMLQGKVESLETKGYMIEIGLKDKSKAFVKYNTAAAKLAEGSLVHVVVQGKTSKLIKCKLLKDSMVVDEDAEEGDDATN